MLRVRGERMICRMIRFLLENGIDEIYIVVGYQKERFQEILREFPQVSLIENPWYETTNNISSIYAAREHLEDCMILEGDQYFFSPAPLARDFEHTEYNAYWQDTPTVEWLAEADENGKIIGCSDTGGEKGWLFYGVSRWTAEDGRRLRRDIERSFEEEQVRDCYWDCVPFYLHPEGYEIYLRKVKREDRVELDSIDELAAFDPSKWSFPSFGKEIWSYREDDMNYQEYDILQALCTAPDGRSQRDLAKASGCSLGIVNRSLQTFRKEGLIDESGRPTEKALQLAAENRSERAVILAAGFGMRMIPMNAEIPKGMLTVHGEVLVERLIRQLHEAGVHEIWVVTGYRKEQYEYLADAFGVKLLFCRDYMTKNNLYTLLTAKDHLENAYIVPCDLYFYRNPFHSCEFYSWYLLSREQIAGAELRVNRSREILCLDGDEDTVGNRIAGLAYIRKEGRPLPAEPSGRYHRQPQQLPGLLGACRDQEEQNDPPRQAHRPRGLRRDQHL